MQCVMASSINSASDVYLECVDDGPAFSSPEAKDAALSEFRSRNIAQSAQSVSPSKLLEIQYLQSVDSQVSQEGGSSLVTVRIDGSDVSEVVGFLSKFGTVFVDRVNGDYYYRVIPEHRRADSEGTFIPSRVTAIPKAYESVPGFKHSSPWDSFTEREKILVTGLIKSMREEVRDATDKRAQELNLDLSVSTVKRGRGRGRPKGSKADSRVIMDGLPVGPMVVQSRSPPATVFEMGPFSALVKSPTRGSRAASKRVKLELFPDSPVTPKREPPAETESFIKQEPTDDI